MKISCRINGKDMTFNCFADKPLLNLIMEQTSLTSLNPGCGQGTCGSCIVFIDGEPLHACLVPAFMIREKEIVTFEGYSKSRFYSDVTRGYEDTGNKPCPYCYSAKTMLIESIIRENSSPKREQILDTLSVNSCDCLEQGELIAIVEAAAKYRRRRRVRRS